MYLENSPKGSMQSSTFTLTGKKGWTENLIRLGKMDLETWKLKGHHSPT